MGIGAQPGGSSQVSLLTTEFKCKVTFHTQYTKTNEQEQYSWVRDSSGNVK